MEEGSLRCDANVSVMLKGAEKFGTKAEVKNVNSFRYIRAALEYEIERQIELLERRQPREAGVAAVEQRRGADLLHALQGAGARLSLLSRSRTCRRWWSARRGSTQILKALPELPEARRARMIAEYDINQQDAMTLTATRAFADSFEAAAKAAKSPKRVVSLITSELTGRLKAAGLELEQSPVSLKGIVQAADLAESGVLSSKMLKQLLDTCFAEGKDFAEVYERDKPQQISDAGAIEAMIDEVIAANPKQVAQYLGGKKTVAAFFVGNVMRLSKGQANPVLLNELVTRKLDSLGGSS
jgi:aspartyl-tRNA(Asn)/glutamyl-tRNA(Gln) amidotransferase subunit B